MQSRKSSTQVCQLWLCIQPLKNLRLTWTSTENWITLNPINIYIQLKIVRSITKIFSPKKHTCKDHTLPPILVNYIIWVVPPPSKSHHQDYEPFLGSGIPTKKPSFPLLLGGGTTQYMDVSKNRGTPKWMVKIMGNPVKMDDLGPTPIFGNSHIINYMFQVIQSPWLFIPLSWMSRRSTSPFLSSGWPDQTHNSQKGHGLNHLVMVYLPTFSWFVLEKFRAKHTSQHWSYGIAKRSSSSKNRSPFPNLRWSKPHGTWESMGWLVGAELRS